MSYVVIYDGDCNLCANFVSILEKSDRGNLFSYIPMQDAEGLRQFDVTAADCEMGMILIDRQHPERRWQGSEAAEEILQLLPLGKPLITAYRKILPLKALGDATYIQVRDHRYRLFGRRDRTYFTAYPVGCKAKEIEIKS